MTVGSLDFLMVPFSPDATRSTHHVEICAAVHNEFSIFNLTVGCRNIFTCLNTGPFDIVYVFVQVPDASKFHVGFHNLCTTSDLLI